MSETFDASLTSPKFLFSVLPNEFQDKLTPVKKTLNNFTSNITCQKTQGEDYSMTWFSTADTPFPGSSDWSTSDVQKHPLDLISSQSTHHQDILDDSSDKHFTCSTKNIFKTSYQMESDKSFGFATEKCVDELNIHNSYTYGAQNQLLKSYSTQLLPDTSRLLRLRLDLLSNNKDSNIGYLTDSDTTQKCDTDSISSISRLSHILTTLPSPSTRDVLDSTRASCLDYQQGSDTDLSKFFRPLPYFPESNHLINTKNKKTRHKTAPSPMNPFIISQPSTLDSKLDTFDDQYIHPLFQDMFPDTVFSDNMTKKKSTSPSGALLYNPPETISTLSSIKPLDKPSTSQETLCLDSFKVYPCQDPNCLERKAIGLFYENKVCQYYHSQRDRRRHPVLCQYKAEPCDHHFNVESDGPLLCPLRDQCDRCHNHHELLYHPNIYKQRFCSSYNQLECYRGKMCAFAHTRDDIRCELFSVEDEKDPKPEFFMNLFKTIWCPYGVQHDWHACLYAHTYQDCRRNPKIGYTSEPCPYWKKDLHSADYERRCPAGSRCPYAHGSKEQLYHASCYKLMPCTDYRSEKKCPRGIMCAFYHELSEKRFATPVTTNNIVLPASLMCYLQKNFSKPPLFNTETF